MNNNKLPRTIIPVNAYDLKDADLKYVHQHFTEECMRRITWVTAAAFVGELILLILDLIGGFFSEHPMNYLNLVAEVVIIISAFISRIFCKKITSQNSDNVEEMEKLLFVFKMILVASVAVFIFTDTYVRHTPLGAYIVFLFVFQIIPFYNAFGNILLFALYMVFTACCYLLFVTEPQANHLFSISAIIFAFGLSEEFLRGFLIRSIVNNRVSRVMSNRFANLASQTIEALSDAVEVKDLYTKGHSQRVATYSREIAGRMGYSKERQDEVYYIGLLHDIGKIGVHDYVINKNGHLTDEEYEEIKLHPIRGYDILKNITEITDISLGARWHHERYDGNGYPDGLKGEAIPAIARIIAVADAYDAMTSNRSYRNVMPQERVRYEIERNAGKQFAPEIAKIMLDMIDEDKDYCMHE